MLFDRDVMKNASRKDEIKVVVWKLEFSPFIRAQRKRDVLKPLFGLLDALWRGVDSLHLGERKMVLDEMGHDPVAAAKIENSDGRASL